MSMKSVLSNGVLKLGSDLVVLDSMVESSGIVVELLSQKIKKDITKLILKREAREELLGKLKVLRRDGWGNFYIRDDFELTGNLKLMLMLKEDLLLLEGEMQTVTSKGFVSDISLCTFPILRDYLSVYVSPESGNDQSTLDESLTLRERRIVMDHFYRLLNLNLYVLLLGIISKEGARSDIKADLKSLLDFYYGRIPASIRESMKQRSVSITKNIYCGFDTEYCNVNMKTNKILSAQLAVNSKVLLTLPLNEDYTLKSMNTHTGVEYPLNPMWYDQSKINFELLEVQIRGYIRNIRELRSLNSNDIAINSVKSKLIGLGIPYFKEKGKIIFSLARSPIKTYFQTSDLEKLDIRKIVELGQQMGIESVNKDAEFLRDLLKIYDLGTKNLLKEEEEAESNFTNLKSVKTDFVEISEEELSGGFEALKLKEPQRKLWRNTGNQSVNLFVRKNFHLIGHLTQADLSLLKGFSDLQNSLDIIGKSLVNLGNSKVTINGYKLKINDTMLLAPGGKKSLSSIGAIYGLPKISLREEDHENMLKFMAESPEKFKEYAVRDSVISLIHAQSLEDAHFKLHKASIPLTLSLLGGANLRKAWSSKGLTGYQVSKEVLIGDSRKNCTPKGLFHLGDVGEVLPQYVSNYKGGRNESFMIGKDNGKTSWYDYDLTAAYASAMCMLGNPNYDLLKKLTPFEIMDMSDKELLYSYTVIKVIFSFPEGTVYPSIPCYADETTTVYPLEGTAVLTGSEYLLARSQNCKMVILGGTIIPYSYEPRSHWEEVLKGNEESGKSPTKDVKLRSRINKFLSKPLVVPLEKDWGKKAEKKVKGWERYKQLAFPPRWLFNANKFESLYMDLPFADVIKDLQIERSKHKKGTIENLLYKEMGNSLYGSVAKGISNKMRYDIKLGKTVRMEAGELSNPIMASHITASVRSLIGGFLAKVSDLGGKAVSVTTDGFISDQEELETKFLTNIGNIESKLVSYSLYKAFSEVRESLGGNSTMLELKHKGKDLISWTTRGQISTGMKNQEIPEGFREGSGLKAATGFQTHGLDLFEIEEIIKSGLNSKGRIVNFVSTNLRSVKDIVKKGGHVTMVYRDQDFRLQYNNNRNVVGINEQTGLYESVPWATVEECLTSRFKGNLQKGTLYQRKTSLRSNSRYLSFLELGIRNFLKYLFVSGFFESYFNSSYREIISFIVAFMLESGVKMKNVITSSYISEIRMKVKNKVLAPNRFLLSNENRLFYDYVVKYIPEYKSVINTKYLRGRI